MYHNFFCNITKINSITNNLVMIFYLLFTFYLIPSREIGGVGPRPEELQHFSHFTILPNQVAPFCDSIKHFADIPSMNRTNAVESTGTK